MLLGPPDNIKAPGFRLKILSILVSGGNIKEYTFNSHPISGVKPTKPSEGKDFSTLNYSHSMVPGGLLVISSTTRFTPFTSFTIRLEIVSIKS